MIISDFPVMMNVSDKFPEFEYTGEYSVLDDGSETGMKQVAFLTTGTLKLANSASGMIIKARGGGGGGGAGSASATGSDGADGSIELLETTLHAGEYTITIGAAGAKGNSAAGGAGGATSFDDLLTAEGSAGGARNGGVNVTRAPLHSTYGYGGEGGSKTQYTGSISDPYVVAYSGSNGMNIYSSPDITSTLLTSYGTNYGVVLHEGTSDPVTYSGTGGPFYYAGYTAIPGYIPVSEVSRVEKYSGSDNRRWYGNDGYPGIVILIGKV